MKYLLLFTFVFSISLYAEQSATTLDIGSTNLIVYESLTQSKSDFGSSGSSRTQNAILERTTSNKKGGYEVEYSFPETNISENDAWKLPARVIIYPGSSIELLNESEIEVRLEKFLDKHPEIREQCGEVVFTWTAFEIHCNTNHVLDLLKSYNLYLGELSEGQPYEELGGMAPVPLKRVSSDGNNLVLQAELVLDPQYLQAEYEKTMEQVATLIRQSVSSTMNDVLQLSGDEKPRFSGTRLVTIKVTSEGIVSELQRETSTTILGGGALQETRTQKETLRRQPVE